MSNKKIFRKINVLNGYRELIYGLRSYLNEYLTLIVFYLTGVRSYEFNNNQIFNFIKMNELCLLLIY